ncbi:MAG: FecR domain-containing protein [Bacteroidales bacterium]|nr:FecR domain-containing protein [Bacteroidales bacterium]
MRIEASERKRKMLFRAFSFVAAAAVIAIVAIFSFSLARNKYNISAMDYTKSLVADYGHISSLTLSDGTEVHLNAGSTLLYPEQFDKSKRIVYLTGEGNFQVAKDPSRPFIVKTAYMDVQALGTTFCIESYLGESAIRTTLKEGRVKVDIPSVNSGSYFLDPDSQLIFRPSEKKVSLARVDARKVLSWEDGYLSFSNASFPQIISSLERKYNVSISYNAEKMRVGNTLNVRFAPEDSLEDALKVLTLLIPGSSFRNIDDRYYYNF